MAIYKLTAVMHGQTIDMSDDLLEVFWRFGEQQPNQAGTLLLPMDGLVQLRNQHSIYDGYNPGMKDGKLIDPTPQVEYSLYRDGNLILRAKAVDGIVNKIDASGKKTVVITLAGAINSSTLWGAGLRLALTGTPLVGEATEKIFDEMGIPKDRQVVDQGHTKIRSWRLNPRTRGSRKEVKNAKDVLKPLARAEGGRIYDDALGNVYFEDRDHRSVFDINDRRYGFKVINSNINSIVGHPTNANTRPLHELIKNTAVSETKKYASNGEHRVGIVDVDGNDVGYPLQLDIPADTREVIYTYYVKLDSRTPHISYMQSWAFPERFTPIDSHMFIRGGFDSIEIIISNPEEPGYTLTIPELRGESFSNTGNNRDIAIRNELSITKFGEKPVIIEADLIENFDQINDYVNNFINRHDGISHNSINVSPLRSISVTLDLTSHTNADFVDTQISHLLEVRLPQLGIERENFWVESVEHKITEKGQHTMKLGLSDARWTQTWNTDSMIFGQNTIVGY